MPRTVFTGSVAEGAELIVALILPVLIGVGILLGLERGVFGRGGGRAVTGSRSCDGMLGNFCSKDFLRCASWMV